MKIKIESLVINGMKAIKETKKYTFSDKVTIQGHNGKGKTTIGEAICYALYGCNIWGNDKADNLLLNNKSRTMEVEISFIITDKEETKHVIKRIKKGRTTEIYHNGHKTTQAKLYNLLPEKNIFIAIFNPAYLINKNPNEARQFLLELMPPISQESIVEQLEEPFKTILKELDFLDANSFLKELRKELNESEKDILYTEGCLDTLKENKTNIPEEKKFDTEVLEGFLSRLKELENQRLEIDYEELLQMQEEQKREILDKLNQLYQNKPNPALKETNELEKTINLLETKKEMLEEQIQNLTAKEGNKCPSCKQIITKEYTETLAKEYQEKIHKYKKDIEEISKEIKKIQEENQQILDESKTAFEKEEEKIKNELEEIDLLIKTTKEDSEKALKKLKDETAEEIEFLKEQIKVLQEKKSFVDKNNTERALLLKQEQEKKEKIEKLEKHLGRVREKIGTLKMQIDAVKEFNAKKTEFLATIIEPFLDKVTIKLEKIVASTGEIKDTFEILYDGRDFKQLSYGETIRVGIELANLIINLTNIQAPIFIDNAESVFDYKNVDTQIFKALAVENSSLIVA